MGNFSDAINGTYVPQGNAAVFWAGQAGFIVKTDKGKLIAIDIYLSDCCERYFSFKRIMPYILEAHELKFDYVIASHGHYDHFDVDAIPFLMHGDCKFVGASDTKAECERLGINKNVTYLSCFDEVKPEEGFSVKGVPCDHGELAPEALGLLICIGGKKIYYMGDTAYREDFLDNNELINSDLLIAPINGMFGNLNSAEAALAAAQLKPKLTVPCHFWNFAEHGGNPNDFKKEMEKKGLSFRILRIGEGIII